MPPTPEIDIARVRIALRTLHQAAPEAAGIVEHWVDLQETRMATLEHNDPFRALVMAMVDSMSRNSTLIEDVRHSVLVPLAQAEEAKEQRKLIEARNETERNTTLRGVLSQPTVVALVGVLSAVLTGLIALVQAYLEQV